MTDIAQDLAALDAALESWPTHGPWHASKPAHDGDVSVVGPGGVSIAQCGYAASMLMSEHYAYVIGYHEAIANAHFIAACSPDRIRRLLKAAKERDEEIERLRAQVRNLEEAASAAGMLKEQQR